MLNWCEEDCVDSAVSTKLLGWQNVPLFVNLIHVFQCLIPMPQTFACCS